MIEKNRVLRAVLRKSKSDVEDCINDRENVYHMDDHGRTYLHLSVFLKADDVALLLIEEAGMNVNYADKDKVTPLHRACRTGCERITELLLTKRADVNAKAVNSITPLHIAAAFGHTKCVQLLTEEEWNTAVDCRDDRGHTPLHYAASEGHVQASWMLLTRVDCDVDAANASGNTPLHFAATHDSPELLLPLVRAKANINAQNINGQTALHMATLQKCTNAVFYLLNNEADPNIKDNHGNTCSHLAIKNGGIEILETLMLDSRTDTSIRDSEESTVLHVALKLGHYNLIPMMLPRARDLTRQDSNGCSVMIEAIKNQLEDLALEMLRACPSLVHTATHDLVTPLHLAAERGMRNLTKQLLIAGAQVDAADSSGLTPSLYCAKNDSVLECLAMIEDIMIIPDNSEDEQQHVKGNKISSRISS